MGTAMMSAQEVGAYIRLLCYQWDNGSVPDDNDSLCRLAGCDGNAVAKIRSKFRSCDGVLKNERMEQERDKQAVYRKKQSENATKRWVGNATALPTHIPKACSPSPSPSPKSNIAPASQPRERNPLFDSLCLVEGIPLGEVGDAGGRIGKALASIRRITPEVTSEEISRRGRNYQSHFSGAVLTATALAKHWGKCHAGNSNGSAPRVDAPVREI